MPIKVVWLYIARESFVLGPIGIQTFREMCRKPISQHHGLGTGLCTIYICSCAAYHVAIDKFCSEAI